MTWVLIIANLMGGGITQVQMRDKAVCEEALSRIEAKHSAGVAAWCVPVAKIQEAGADL